MDIELILQKFAVFSGLTGEELQTNIACAAALCVPSVCFENCPLSILEARMLGTPSITMPYGGMAELVALLRRAERENKWVIHYGI